jgi:hypothetical protein
MEVFYRAQSLEEESDLSVDDVQELQAHVDVLKDSELDELLDVMKEDLERDEGSIEDSYTLNIANLQPDAKRKLSDFIKQCMSKDPSRMTLLENLDEMKLSEAKLNEISAVLREDLDDAKLALEGPHFNEINAVLKEVFDEAKLTLDEVNFEMQKRVDKQENESEGMVNKLNIPAYGL